MAPEHVSDVPLVVITGPTASGKTALALQLAEKYGGEIICADSRTVYRGMDIGTAKPSLEERQHITHWGVDLVEPGESFSAADFKQYAKAKIDEIRRRGHIPFLVGGTGLYIDAVLFDFSFATRGSEKMRLALEVLSIEQLHEYCIERNIMLPKDDRNKRRIIRAIERQGDNLRKRNVPIEKSIVVGIATEMTALRRRIEHRAEQLFRDGVVEEAIKLGQKYGWNNEAMTGNIYPLVHQYTDGECSLEEIKQQFVTLDYKLAKRQMTWLRRNPYIEWCALDDAPGYIEPLLASEYNL